MQSLDSLDAHLQTDFLDDYWSDDAKFHATPALRQMSEKEWDDLAALIPQRSSRWLTRLADVLYSAPPVHAVPMLLKLLQLLPSQPEFAEVHETAVDSLTALADDGIQIALGAEDITRLESLANSRSGSFASNVRSLLNKSF